MRRNDFTEEQLLTRIFNNKSQKTYWDNARELHRRGGEETFTRCYQLAKSGNDREKEIAVDILAQLGVSQRPYLKQSQALFFEMLDSVKTGDVLIAVLNGIRFNNADLSVAQVTAVCAFKSHADKYVRLGVVFALLGVERKLAIDTLVGLTTDKYTPVRSWATFAIGTHSEKRTKSISAALWKRVKDKDEETKFEAIVGLAVRKEAGIKDVIIEELLTGKFGTLLFEAIEGLGDTDFLPVLKRLQKESLRDKTINPSWLQALEDTISSLSAPWLQGK